MPTNVSLLIAAAAVSLSHAFYNIGKSEIERRAAAKANPNPFIK